MKCNGCLMCGMIDKLFYRIFKRGLRNFAYCSTVVEIEPLINTLQSIAKLTENECIYIIYAMRDYHRAKAFKILEGKNENTEL